MSYETDGLRRDIERLRLEFTLEKGEHERTSRSASESRNALENARREISGLQEEHGRLRDRVEALEASAPSSTAELLVLIGTFGLGMAGLLMLNTTLQIGPPGCWGCSRTTRQPRSPGSRLSPRSCPTEPSPPEAAHT